MERRCKLEAQVKKVQLSWTGHEGAEGNKGIAPLYLDLSVRLRSVVDVTIRPLYRRKSTSVSFQVGAGWASGPVWMCCEINLLRTGFELRSVQPVAYATMLPTPLPPGNLEILELFTISDTATQQYVHSITRITLCMEHCFTQRQNRYQMLMIGTCFSAIMQLLW